MALNLFASVAFFVLQFGINFFITPFILGSLGSEAYGFLILTGSLISYSYILTALSNAMTGHFIASNYHKNDILSASSFYTSALIANIFFSFLIALFGIFFIIYLVNFIHISPWLVLDVKICFCLYALNVILGLYNGILGIHAFSKNKMYLLSFRQAFSSLISAFFMLILYYFYTPLISYAPLSALFASVLILFSSLLLAKKLNTKIKFQFNLFCFDKLKILCKAGAFSSLTLLAQNILNSVELLFCNIFLNAASMGLGAVLKTVVIFIVSFIGAVAHSYMAHFIELYSKNNTKALLAELAFSSKILCFICAVPIAVFMVFCKDFYTLWLPFNKSEVLLISNLTLISLIPASLLACMQLLINLSPALNKQKNSSLAMVILSLITAIALFVALKFFNAGLMEMFIISALLYSLKIIVFDIFNAAVILGVKISSFVYLFLRNFGVFALILTILALLKTQILNINSWLSLIFFCALFLLFAYLMAYFLLFNSYEKTLFKNKIKGHVRL